MGGNSDPLPVCIQTTPSDPPVSRNSAAERAMGLLPPSQAHERRNALDLSRSPLRRSVAKFVHNPRFDEATMLLIFAYALQIGVQTDYMARHMDEQSTPPAFRA